MGLNFIEKSEQEEQDSKIIHTHIKSLYSEMYLKVNLKLKRNTCLI